MILVIFMGLLIYLSVIGVMEGGIVLGRPLSSILSISGRSKVLNKLAMSSNVCKMGDRSIKSSLCKSFTLLCFKSTRSAKQTFTHLLAHLHLHLLQRNLFCSNIGGEGFRLLPFTQMRNLSMALGALASKYGA